MLFSNVNFNYVKQKLQAQIPSTNFKHTLQENIASTHITGSHKITSCNHKLQAKIASTKCKQKL